MNIYLVRHGKQIGGTCNEDVELSELGCKQADLTGQRLKKYDIDIIFCSHLIRAVKTAEVINRYTNVGIETREELQEISFGDMEGKDEQFIEINFSKFYEKFNRNEEDVHYPNGECGEDVRKRAMKIIEEIKSKGYKNAVVVAHGGTIRSLISGILGLGQERRVLIGLPFENCSISIIKYDSKGQKYYVHTVNDYSHLEELS